MHAANVIFDIRNPETLELGLVEFDYKKIQTFRFEVVKKLRTA